MNNNQRSRLIQQSIQETKQLHFGRIPGGIDPFGLTSTQTGMAVISQQNVSGETASESYSDGSRDGTTRTLVYHPNSFPGYPGSDQNLSDSKDLEEPSSPQPQYGERNLSPPPFYTSGINGSFQNSYKHPDPDINAYWEESTAVPFNTFTGGNSLQSPMNSVYHRTRLLESTARPFDVNNINRDNPTQSPMNSVCEHRTRLLGSSTFTGENFPQSTVDDISDSRTTRPPLFNINDIRGIFGNAYERHSPGITEDEDHLQASTAAAASAASTIFTKEDPTQSHTDDIFDSRTTGTSTFDINDIHGTRYGKNDYKPPPEIVEAQYRLQAAALPFDISCFGGAPDPGLSTYEQD